VSHPTFLEAFEELVGASGWRRIPSPSELLQQWEAFVEACEEGYDDNIHEFENDRSVRDLWGRILHDPTLRRFPELDDLREAVERIDERYRRLSRDDVLLGRDGDPWWRRRVPRQVGDELADDLAERYGIEPEG
jgi:hypothetical protein